ncbi:AMP-binding protein [Gramella sp. GC03-9]|uniref:AMP-binding protein n=1 Tax=Christiangramia oceanisediminis TaxID=2920386 RepID=A0A9X2I2M8_9FLAO|nr:AMP-binding protein [Gramella oceanisediminis]MCP9198715.1 AMP-binding protein [Gramella oceanisediminis]
MNYFDWIGKWSVYTPDKVAVRCADSDGCYTYKELHQEALRLEAYLQNELNITQGDRIAVLGQHSIEYLILFIAAQRMGAILVPLNYRSSVPEFVYCLKDTEPALLVFDLGTFGDLNDKIQEQISVKGLSFQEMFQAASGFEAVETKKEILPEQPVFIFYTSGTTGKPKGVVYTNKMLFWNSLNTSVQLEITSKDSTLNVLPPYHTSGWNVLVLPMLHRGARVDFMRAFKAKRVLDYLQKEKISLFLAIPTMLKMMAGKSCFSDFKAPHLKYMVVGGESLSVSLIDTWAQKGVLLRQGYGLTEAGPCITSLHHHDALWKKGSIGKLNFYVDHRILDEEGREVATGTPGELCLSGNIVTPGYWNNSAYTLEKIKDGWFYTGDIVSMDDAGFMYIHGRKNQMFISGGENIYPSEIENVLIKSEFVREVAVLGVPDENWGETGVAFVVPVNRDVSEEQLFHLMKQHLASYKIPKAIVFLESLPKIGIGKIDRQSLKKKYKSITHEKKNIS